MSTPRCGDRSSRARLTVGAVAACVALLVPGCSGTDQGPQEQPGGAPAKAEGTPPATGGAPVDPAELRGRVDRLLGSAPITFAPESTQVTQQGQQTIVELSSMLESPPPGVRVEIVGYTEQGPGGADRAQKLSAKRARVVAKQLAQQGAPPDVLHARGGGTAPPDSGPARRVDVTIR